MAQIKIQNLILDVDNYRIGHQEGEPQAIKAIIEEQGTKLVALAKDIIKNGLSPIERLFVMPAPGSNVQYIVIEGNRRISAIKLIKNPDLAVGTWLEADFRKLNSKPKDKLPDEADCVVVSTKEDGKVWIRRRHDRGLEGAGLEEWGSVARERADADAGKYAPAKEIREFVVANSNLPNDVKEIINSPKFNNTNLTRLIGTKHIKDILSFENQGGKLVSTANPQWLLQVLSEMLRVIATKEINGNVFSEADIDKLEQRKEFINNLIKKYPKPSNEKVAYGVNAEKDVKPKASPKSETPKPPKPNPASVNRKFLIPSTFGFSKPIPDGKINNIYHELKRLSLDGNEIYPNAVGVLLRVFIEFSIERYIDENNIPLESKGTDRAGNDKYKDKLVDKIQLTMKYMESSKVATKKELDPIRKEMKSQFSILSTDTLNAYVHNKDINPKPLELKMTWDAMQEFITKLWS